VRGIGDASAIAVDMSSDKRRCVEMRRSLMRMASTWSIDIGLIARVCSLSAHGVGTVLAAVDSLRTRTSRSSPMVPETLPRRTGGFCPSGIGALPRMAALTELRRFAALAPAAPLPCCIESARAFAAIARSFSCHSSWWAFAWD
jgi:hypothetical protein